MKAYFALFLIIALVGMAMAGVHHYRIPSKGNDAKDSAQHGGSIFDFAANGLNGIATGIENVASGILG